MSPRRSGSGSGRHLVTRMRSPLMSVGSIDPDGIQNDWKRKVLIRKLSTSALTTTIRISLVYPQMRRPAEAGASAGASSLVLMSVLALLADARLLTAKAAEVVQLGATNVATAHELDVVDGRSVHGERALNANTERDLAHREGGADALTLATDDNALEDLDAGTGTLDDLDVHLDGVARAERGNVVAELARGY